MGGKPPCSLIAPSEVRTSPGCDPRGSQAHQRTLSCARLELRCGDPDPQHLWAGPDWKSSLHRGNQVNTRLSGQVLINRTHVLMAKGRPDTDADAEGRWCPQADGAPGQTAEGRRRPQADGGRGRGRKRCRRPPSVASGSRWNQGLRFKPWSVGPSRPPWNTHTEDHEGHLFFPQCGGKR